MQELCTGGSLMAFSPLTCPLPFPTSPTTQDVYETKEKIHLVQELCTGGSLMAFLQKSGPLGEDKAAGIFRGILKCAPPPLLIALCNRQ